MGASKIVNEQEVVGWFAEGKTYAWMSEEYLTKYNIETVPSLWGNFRRRRGLARRITRDDNLIPWFVQPQHRWAYPVAMLRSEARARSGMGNSENTDERLASWKQTLQAANAVVHYDPDTADGFYYVPRLPSDTDIIRQPRLKTTRRKAAD
ncbi:hypothetical protein [Aeromicrobium sp.]|uniref:hypothetical protein n=1 Tax=Aeromicrobium sp. TaxID=1871063 RepID=UPI0019C38723|nr:hypothetical protein [Aeromicrobium sp.]MBC7630747.1 hypothetical protein [Aeromicrobium sp.]